MNNEQSFPDLSPHPFTEWFFIIVIGVPIIAVLIWSIKYPKESYLFGKRWMFKDEPDVSDEGVFIIRLTSIIVLIIVLLFIGSRIIG